MRKLTSLLAAVILFTVSASAGDIRVLVQKAKPCVVHIATFDKDGKLLATGTGFFISADGYLVTNEHVVDGAHSILARDYKGTIFHVFHSKDNWIEETSVNAADPDVILLRADATNVPYLTIGPTANEVEGQRVLIIGNPENQEFTVADGLISAFREHRSVIQISAPISPGSSGSPVIDTDSGQVIGIVVGTRDGQNLNYAIASEKIQGVIAETGFISQTTPPVAVATPTPYEAPMADRERAAENSNIFQVAFIAWKAGNYEFAIGGFDEEIAQLGAWEKLATPVNLEAWKNHRARVYALRGDAQRHLKHYGNALRDYTEAIRLCPDAEFSYAGRSAVYEALGDRSQAAQDMKKARELKGNK